MAAAVRSSLDRIVGGWMAAQGCPPPLHRFANYAKVRRGRRGLPRKECPGWLEGRQGNSGPGSFVLGGGASGDVPVQGPVGTPTVTVTPVLGCELVSALIITTLCS